MPYTSLAPNYAEARSWFVYLDVFTPSDLADSMGIHLELAERFIVAGVWHGIIYDSGDRINGRGPSEPIYHYVHLTVFGPHVHPREQPEWKTTPGCYSLAPLRGMPVFTWSDRDRRQLLSTPGARHRMKLREQRRKNMEQARMDALEEQRRKGKIIPKWKLNKLKRKKG